MKITKVKCDQFAGIRDRNISFKEGINIVCGPNESGKSTLANLISSTFFQNCKVNRRNAVDKTFIMQFYPSTLKSGRNAGDYIDGAITFETDNGVFTINKEWGDNPSCKLSTPQGNIKSPDEIDAILRNELIYGEGVYRDILLTSQKNINTSIESILKSENNETKKEIASIMAKALADTGSVSAGELGAKIEKKIGEIKGAHWDEVQSIPERRATRARWSNGIGTILKAFYDVEDAQDMLDEIKEREEALSSAEGEYREVEQLVRELKASYENFNQYASQIKTASLQQEKRVRVKADGADYEAAISKWPEMVWNLNKAEKFLEERQNRNLIEHYDTLKVMYDEIEALKKMIRETNAPSENEVKAAKKLDKEITHLVQKLGGLNLSAQIKLLGDHEISVRTVSTGESVAIKDGEMRISEAVILTIPDVMEMKLSPADIDTDAVQKDITAKSDELNMLFEKYNVETIEKLEENLNSCNDSKRQLDNKNQRFTDLLDSESWEDLEADRNSVTEEVRTKKEIADDIAELCKKTELSAYKEVIVSQLDGYIAKYTSMDNLKEKVDKNAKELADLESEYAKLKDIPEEFKDIKDADQYLNELKKEKEEKEEEIKELRDEKVATAKSLEDLTGTLEIDPEEALRKAQQAFETEKTTLKHWVHIKEVFNKLKDNINNNPLEDMAESFKKYLGDISKDRVDSEFPESDKFNMNIYSGDYLVDYDKLSEGTKDTVSLAFRLAVLEHLYPQGGAVVLFDDPFTDMDPYRTKQGCNLVKEFAVKNQVIFLTCDDKYKEMLGGNVIEI